MWCSGRRFHTSICGVDRTVFHFLTDASDRAAYAAVMANAVPSGGHAIVGTFALDGPERCSGLPVCRYNKESLAAEFAPLFRLVVSINEDHITPAGKFSDFSSAVCRGSER